MFSDKAYKRIFLQRGTAMLFNLPSTNWEYYYIWNLGYYEKVTVNSLFKKLFS